MYSRVFQNIKQKNSFLSIVTVCLIILIFNCVSFIFSDLNDDNSFFYSQTSFSLADFVSFYLIEQSSELVLSAFCLVIRGRSPPFV